MTIKREIKYTSQFKRDYKREKAGQHKSSLDNDLTAAIELIASDIPLTHRYRDHPLSGEWKDCRDCHLKPDLILIYKKPDRKSLVLIRLGSHSELSI